MSAPSRKLFAKSERLRFHLVDVLCDELCNRIGRRSGQKAVRRCLTAVADIQHWCRLASGDGKRLRRLLQLDGDQLPLLLLEVGCVLLVAAGLDLGFEASQARGPGELPDFVELDELGSFLGALFRRFGSFLSLFRRRAPNKTADALLEELENALVFLALAFRKVPFRGGWGERRCRRGGGGLTVKSKSHCC